MVFIRREAVGTVEGFGTTVLYYQTTSSVAALNTPLR